MKIKKYSCPNGCKLPPRKKQLKEFNDGSYGFHYNDSTFCPCCGSLMPYSLEKLTAFFDVYRLHPSLDTAKRLLCKSEFEAAAREMKLDELSKYLVEITNIFIKESNNLYDGMEEALKDYK